MTDAGGEFEIFKTPICICFTVFLLISSLSRIV